MLGRLLGGLMQTRVGRRALVAAAVADPATAIGAAGFALERRSSFETTRSPERIAGFEDLAFLFSSNQANFGIAQLSFIEGAHLYRTVRETPGPHVEIGRYKGGGTLLLAAALRPEDELWSYDTLEKGGDRSDRGIEAALVKYGLEDRVHLIVGDSHEVALPAFGLGSVFLDGDPSFEGTRIDVERWGGALRDGGQLLFHDATFGAPRYRQLAPLLEALDRDSRWQRRPDVGSIVQFERTGA